MRNFTPLFYCFFLLLFFPRSSSLFAQSCTDADSGSLTINPPIPADGSNYPGGTVVEMCFTLSEFNTPSINWLQSIIPTFGPGFDFSTFTVTSLPTSCSGAGSWGYFDMWTSCALGIDYGPGFSFDGSAGLGCGGTPNDGNPGNNWGDGGFLCPNRTWCWELTTVPVSPFSCQLTNYNTTIFVYGDAETGSWNPAGGGPCLNDEPLCVPGLVNLEPTQDPTPCGCTVISATWDNQQIGQECGLNYMWTGPGGYTSNQLTNEVCTPGLYTLSMNIGNCVDFTISQQVVISGTPAAITASASPTSVCAGEEITFTATGLGAGASYTWTIDGNFYNGATVTVPVTGSGAETATVSGFTSLGCPADAQVIYVVLPTPQANITLSDNMICSTGSTTVSTSSPGTLTWDFGTATVNSGSGNGPYNLSFPGAGTYPIILTAANTACSTSDTVFVEVVDPVVTPQVTCSVIGSDSISFVWTTVPGVTEYEISVDGGMPFVVTDTSYGIGGLTNGTTVTLDLTAIGSSLCPSANVTTAMCEVISCDPITLDIDQPAQDFCLTGTNDSLPLTFTQLGAGIIVDTLWSGPGVTNDYFDPDAAGLGVHQVFLSITTDINCIYRDTVAFEVFPLPAADFTVTSPICLTDFSVITYTGGADPTTATFNWDFGGGTILNGSEAGPYEVQWSSAGNQVVTLLVEDANCASTLDSQTVLVVDPLPVPSPGCGGGGLDSVSFNWPAIPGANGYVISINNGPQVTVDTTNVGVGGLNEGDPVTLTIFALGDAPCGNSLDTTITCVAEACPDLTVLIDQSTNEFCLGADPDFIVLDVSQNSGSGTGNYAWSGPGVSNDTFYVAAAGLGTHQIIMNYTEGFCTYGDTTNFSVYEIPPAGFLVSTDSVCISTDITVTNEVAEIPGASYAWTITGGNPMNITGYGPHLIAFPAAGTYDIVQTVSNNGCSSSDTLSVLVIEPLLAPAVSCSATQSLETITFDWTAADPNIGYEVTIDGVIVDTVTGLSYTVAGLTPDTTISVTVRALGDGPCGDGTSSSLLDCATLACPVISLSPSAVQTSFCLGSNDLPVTLTATSTGGDMTGSFSWSGPGVVMVGPGFAFDPVAAGIGTHLLIVDYVETAGCGATDSLTMNVYDIPTPDFSLTANDVCRTDSVVVTYTGTAGPTATYTWDFGTAAVTALGSESYQLSWPAAGTYDISLLVSENGCESGDTATVVVSEPLTAVVMECLDPTLTSVNFSWLAVPGATAYEIQTGTVTDTVTGLTYAVTGLSPDQTVTISVTPLGPPPCSNGPSTPFSCTSLPCPSITVTPMASQQAFCLDSNATVVLLTATSTGGDMTGTFSWSGPGVIDSMGVFYFDPTQAGNGQHLLTVDYVETAGCTGDTTLTMNVFAAPTADFTLQPDLICTNQTTTVSYTGNASANATYDWDFNGATVIDLGNQTYELTWAVAGSYTVSLTVYEAGCSSSFSLGATVEAPLADPAPTCGETSLTSVTFNWPSVSGATGYLLSINGELPFPATDTFYTVSGLSPGELVELSLVATGPQPCGNSEIVVIECNSLDCPAITLEPSATQTVFCTDTQLDPVALELAVTGGDSTGIVNWSGTGVEVATDGSFVFNPSGLAPGDYLLTIDYTQSVCDYTASLLMTVNPTPAVVLTSSADELCASGSVTVSFNGTAVAGAVYNWDFDGATNVVDLGNEAYELSWTQTGTYTVSLMVDQAGCTDVASLDLSVTAPPQTGGTTVPAAVCQNSGVVLELSELLTGADPGGVWSPINGAPAAVDPASGSLSTANLAAGTYTYEYRIDGGVCDDAVNTVAITVEPAPIADAGSDQLLTCTTGMVTLDGAGSSGGVGLTYTWTGPDGLEIVSGSTSPTIEVAEAGNYTLAVTSEIGCTATANVFVEAETEVPIPQVEISNIGCFSGTDGTILVTDVDGGRPPYTYSLNGSTPGNTTFFTGLAQGDYLLRVTDANGCFTEISLGISRPDELSISIELPNDDNIYNEGDVVNMTANISGGNTIDTLVWQPDSLNQLSSEFSNTISFLADETRTISVTVTDVNGCSATDRSTIIVRKKRPVYFPSGFSPNGDNVNDIFFIGANMDQVVQIQEFLVFNRWGESVFENYEFQPNDPVQGWDGTQRGETLNPQVFVYVAKVEFTNGDVVVYKGDVTLIR